MCRDLGDVVTLSSEVVGGWSGKTRPQVGWHLGSHDARLPAHRVLHPQCLVDGALITGAFLYFYGVASFGAWRDRVAQAKREDEVDT